MKQLILKNTYRPSQAMSDVYRRIRTNIVFSGVENKVICFTGCEAGEGKSLVTFALAKTFAENGSRVLLIDADLRNSYLYEQFGVSHEATGLAHFLSGLSVLEDCIYSTNIEGVCLIPAGAVCPNSTELLGKRQMKQLIASVRKVFDYVLIDTPPLGLLVDAAIVASQSDASILIVDASHNRRRTVSMVQKQLIEMNPNFLGIILNKVEDTSHRYGKRYGYGYGYGNFKD